jgi:hypothetical protein
MRQLILLVAMTLPKLKPLVKKFMMNSYPPHFGKARLILLVRI